MSIMVGCVLISLLKCPFSLILLWDSMNFGILKIQGTATKNGSSKKGFPLYSHPQDNSNDRSFMAWYPGLILLSGYTNCPDIYHNGDN